MDGWRCASLLPMTGLTAPTQFDDLRAAVAGEVVTLDPQRLILAAHAPART